MREPPRPKRIRMTVLLRRWRDAERRLSELAYRSPSWDAAFGEAEEAEAAYMSRLNGIQREDRRSPR
jgi:hypothetical protein